MAEEPNFFPPLAGNNNPNIPPTSPPVVRPPHKSVLHWLIVVVAITAVVGYFVVSFYTEAWPFGSMLKPLPQQNYVLLDNIPAPTQDPTVDWQTYRNNEYGFEFKYPGDWAVIKPDNQIIYLAKKTEEMAGGGITISKSSGILEDIENDLKSDLILVSSDAKIINGIQWNIHVGKEKREPPEPPMTFISFYSEKDQNIISFGAIYNPLTNELIDQILSTFKFINVADTSDWPTYRNEEFGFEFKYPGKLELREYMGARNLVLDTNGDWTVLLSNQDYNYTFSGYEKMDADTVMKGIESSAKLGNVVNDTKINNSRVIVFNAKQHPKEEGEYYEYYCLYAAIFGNQTVILEGGGRNPVCLSNTDDLARYDKERLFNQILSTFRFLR